MLVHGVLIFAASIAGIVRAGNTTCKTTSLDWYTQSVGEMPCRTYERLRQLCSADYQVGDFRSATPGDNCGGQPATCCCNSVSWALSMLCMNCQYGVGSSVNGDTGFDAGVGAYGGYLNNCGRPTNKTLPDTIQTAVCKQNIKIPAFTYNLFWVDGAWFYEYSKGTAQLDISSGKNDTGLCPTPSPSSTSSTATSTVTAAPQPTSSQSSTPVGAIAGGVVGGVVLLAAAVLLGFFISRRRKNRGGVIDLTDESKPPSATFESYNLPPGAIAQPVAITPYAAPSSTEGTSTTGSPPPTQASSSRHNKPGMIAPSPPNRAEMYQSHPLLSTQGGSSSHISSDDRHEDSEDLSSAYGLGRSASGRLPPAYRG